jgi:hypothetical protein
MLLASALLALAAPAVRAHPAHPAHPAVAPAPAAPSASPPAALLAPVPAPVPAPVGPPAICHPIDIGEARSLPWRGGGFGVHPDQDLGRVVEDARAVLRGTPDTLVHMETVRRAVIYLSGAGGAKHGGDAAHDAAWRAREIGRFVAALKADVVDAQLDDGADEGTARRLALAWFDAGYTLCALEQAGHLPSGASREDGLELLERAVALAPQDGAINLGLSIAHFGDGRPGRTCYAYLDKAVAAADDPDGLLRRNLLHTMGSFLGTATYEELASKVRAALERA